MATVEARPLPLTSCSQSSIRTTTPISDSGHTTCRHPTIQPSIDLQIPSEGAACGTGEVSSYLDGLPIDGVDIVNTLDSMTAVQVTPANDSEDEEIDPPRPSASSHGHVSTVYHDPVEYRTPFHKWMRTLHKRARQRPRSASSPWGPHYHLPTNSDGTPSVARSRRSHHARSSSASSYAFVAAVKSASGSLASASAITRQRKTASRSQTHTRTERSSRASFTAARLSEDSGFGDRLAPPDPAAADRAIQRRLILEELINTEEGYIRDVRFLMNVYVTILASLPALSRGLRSSINHNLAEIVELHEDILGDLHRIVPDSEYSQSDASFPPRPLTAAAHGHRRWRSLDVVPEDKDPMSWLKEVRGLSSEAQIAGDTLKMDRFFIYEEYGAKYEMMIKDVAMTHRSMPDWESHQRGLEVLASSLGSVNSQGYRSRKSLTIGDLLPIQRICKYPLLFAELLRHTPVEDDPNSHMEVESALLRLREATAEINRATNDTKMKDVLQKTWILQDRLVMPNQRIDASSRNRIRSFGHVELCGTLHVCWQTNEGIRGQYMVVLLYRDMLCLASASKVDQIYTIEACITLSSVKVEDADNGRGLQCHTAPFSWKLVFECDSQLYELIMTACNAREQDEWRRRLEPPLAESPADATVYSSLYIDIKSLGTVFSKPGTVARRISIHRATTVGPKTGLCQVILKNTSALKDSTTSLPMNPSINRSQSLLTTHCKVPILAPHRGERARLEALLADVWSRNLLPFPGMTNRSRSEQIVRSSASTVMRKLSVTSIATTFTRRSNSVVSMTKMFSDDEAADATAEPRRMASFRHARENRPTSEQEFKTPPESPTKSTLSNIQDESDGRSSLSSESSTTGLEMAATVVWDKEKPLLARNHGDATGPVLSCLPPSAAAQEPQRGRRDEELSPKSTPCPSLVFVAPSDDRDRYQKKPKLAHKTSRRWARVGSLNKDFVVQGLRSIFR
ncbi:RSP protein [Plectosphaerella plurivora]|uniref:RSP protein n=1 Tax=Plectosphaerella plurivora TaxID=936078 RepID=A0A9P9A9M1_9PEZI|nr:RSP protein [Plectosphaerella plurivora]